MPAHGLRACRKWHPLAPAGSRLAPSSITARSLSQRQAAVSLGTSNLVAQKRGTKHASGGRSQTPARRHIPAPPLSQTPGSTRFIRGSREQLSGGRWKQSVSLFPSARHRAHQHAWGWEIPFLFAANAPVSSPPLPVLPRSPQVRKFPRAPGLARPRRQEAALPSSPWGSPEGSFPGSGGSSPRGDKGVGREPRNLPRRRREMSFKGQRREGAGGSPFAVYLNFSVRKGRTRNAAGDTHTHTHMPWGGGGGDPC